MSAASAFMALLGCAAFACFTWGTLRHFVWQANGSAGAWAISLLSWAGLFVFLWQVAHAPLSPAWPAAAILIALSIAVWAWALRETTATPPTLAFTGDDPRFLLDAGPYRWVRHPFYSAYLLFWTGAALAPHAKLGWVAAIVMGLVYWFAARHEEGKFARSALAPEYQGYAARTGMFLPRYQA